MTGILRALRLLSGFCYARSALYGTVGGGHHDYVSMDVLPSLLVQTVSIQLHARLPYCTNKTSQSGAT